MTQPQPPQLPPGQQYQQPVPPPLVTVSHQMVETKRHGLTGPHAALIITAAVIGVPLFICLLCSLLTLVGANSSAGH